MRKKTTAKSLAILLGAAMALTACNGGPSDSSSGGNSSKPQESSADTSKEDIGVSAEVTKFEDIQFTDEMPIHPTMAEKDYYAYDDMSKSYKLEFFTYNTPADDPILSNLKKKYNVDLTLTTVPDADTETTLSTRFASDSEPDLLCIGSSPTYKDLLFTLAEQNLLVSAKEMYPYMPQTAKFATKTLIQYSTMSNGEIPFTTKYSIQDGDIWGLAIRQDWLDKFNMKPPTTREELLAYAKACVENDPDGNGQKDTYFMSGAGGGKGFGMLEAFMTMFGNTSEHVGANGELVSPMFDGTQKAYLQFVNELYTNGYLTPDWYTIDWEQNKSYTMNDRVGMVRYPASNLYSEYYRDAKNRAPEALNVWTYWKEPPIENGKYGPGGNPGVFCAISSRKLGDDQGKLMRICHMLDAICYGGEDYFTTVQGGGNEVHEGYDADVREYTKDGLSICYVDKTHPGYTKYGKNNLELAPWQNFGYTLKYQIAYESDEKEKPFADKINEMTAVVASYPRWPNDGLLISLPAGTAPNLTEYEYSQNFKFATGERSFDEWDAYIKEWLDQGGRDKMKATAESLGCTLPDEMK